MARNTLAARRRRRYQCWLEGTTSSVTVRPDGQKVSTVLVDDSSELRALVRRRLEQSGLFEVVAEGGDGDEAISLVIRHEPELLLLDTSMPTCDGLQALPAILAVCPDTTVVMFTGFEEQGLAERARELGAVDVLEKSIPLHELPERLIRCPLYRSPDRLTPAQPLEPRGKRARLRDHRGAARPRRARRPVPGPLRPCGDRHGHVDGDGQHRPRQRRPGRAHVVRAVRPGGRRLRSADQRRGDLLDRGLREITVRGKDLATVEHAVPSAGVSAPPDRPAHARPDPRRPAPGALRLRPGAGHQRPACRRGRPAADRGELPAAGGRRRRVRHLHAGPPTGKVVSWNAGAQRIKGYAPSEIIGQLVPGLLPAGGARDRSPRAQPGDWRAATASTPRKGGGSARTAASSGRAS